MRFGRLLAVVLLVLGLTAAFAVVQAPVQAAACYGASCNGANPEGRCSHDAKTVGAMHVKDGMLELRWSPSCVANWGRYTPYVRNVTGYALANPPIGIWARVTVWNPGKASYGTAHNADLNIYASTWSHMTDGRPKACTGVEVFHLHTAESGSGAPADMESQGWFWGLCY
jgi:hypothetical protein